METRSVTFPGVNLSVSHLRERHRREVLVLLAARNVHVVALLRLHELPVEGLDGHALVVARHLDQGVLGLLRVRGEGGGGPSACVALPRGRARGSSASLAYREERLAPAHGRQRKRVRLLDQRRV